MKVIKKFEQLFDTGPTPSIIPDPQNDELVHIIGGSPGNIHRTMNFISGEIKHIHSFYEYAYKLESCGIVYIKHKNVFLLFNCDMPMNSYDLNIKTWTNLNIKMPSKAYCFGYIITHDQKYIVVFCGGIWKANSTLEACREILIFDIDRMEWIISNIKCPECTGCVYMDAVLTMNNEIHLFVKSKLHWKISVDEIIKSSDILIFGYMRVCQILNSIPDDIVNEIVRFYGAIIV